MKQIKLLLFIFLFTMLALGIRGYEYGVADQTHYLTFVKFQLHPSLYPDDTLIREHGVGGTIFVDFVATLAKLTGNLEISVFLLYSLCFYGFFILIYALAMKLFNDRLVAFLAMTLLIYPFPIGGSSITTFDSLLTMRIIAEVFLLAAIYSLMTNHWVPSAIIAAIGFFFHPLTLIPYPFILVLLASLEKKRRRAYLSSLCLFTILAIPMAIQYLIRSANDPVFIDPAWLEIVKSRLPYAFFLSWRWQEWLLVSLYFLILLFYFLTAKKRSFEHITAASLAISVLLLATHIVADFFAIKTPLQLQLTRNLYLAVIFSILYLAKIIRSFSSQKIVLMAVIVCIMGGWLLLLPKRYDIPVIKPRNDFEKVAVWAKEHTPTQSLFVIPPNHSGFRLWSERSVVTEYKEGADSLYSRTFAYEWYRRQQLLHGYFIKNEKDFLTLRHVWNFNYIVSDETLSFPVAFRTTQWTLYKIDFL